MEINEFVDKVKEHENFESIQISYDKKQGYELFVKLKHTLVAVKDRNSINYDKVYNDIVTSQEVIKWLT